MTIHVTNFLRTKYRGPREEFGQHWRKNCLSSRSCPLLRDTTDTPCTGVGCQICYFIAINHHQSVVQNAFRTQNWSQHIKTRETVNKAPRTDMMDLMEKHFSLLALDIERTMTRPVDDLLSNRHQSGTHLNFNIQIKNGD